jgi:lipopolysaccharide biosynthesis glycosyltransferase
MNIAFCINTLALPGLGVTISSLIRNCSNTNRLEIYFFCFNLSDKAKSKIESLLVDEDFKGQSYFVDFNPEVEFSSFNSLHGDWTAYGRLLLANYISASKILYLDADLVIEVDVLKLDDFSFDNYFLAAVSGGKIKDTLGKNFYINEAGLSGDLDYFNSGVLLIHLDEWRFQNITAKCLEIGRKLQGKFPAQDQSILNIICQGNFAKLPSLFNCEWPVGRPKPSTAPKMILHFVGSPKPWDLFGNLIHEGYSTWKKYLNPKWITISTSLSLDNLKRTWNIRRSYIRSIKNKTKKLN